MSDKTKQLPTAPDATQLQALGVPWVGRKEYEPYSKDKADYILNEVRNGRHLEDICSDDEQLDPHAFRFWCNSLPEIKEEHDKAVMEAHTGLIHKMMKVAEDDRHDENYTEEGVPIVNEAKLKRDKLKVDTYNKIARLIGADKYMQKQQINIGVKIESPFGDMFKYDPNDTMRPTTPVDPNHPLLQGSGANEVELEEAEKDVQSTEED